MTIRRKDIVAGLVLAIKLAVLIPVCAVMGTVAFKIATGLFAIM